MLKKDLNQIVYTFKHLLIQKLYTMKFKGYFVIPILLFLHSHYHWQHWYKKKCKWAKNIVAYALLDRCGWKGRNQIMSTGKGQYQLVNKQDTEAAMGPSPK